TPVEPTEEPTTVVEPTVEPTTAPVTDSDFYLVGNMNAWAVDDAYNLTKNTAADTEEYMITVDLTTDSEFKIVKIDGVNIIWYPSGMDNNYGQHDEIAANGTYTVYFRPNADGGEGWFNGVIYAAMETPAPTTVEPTTAPEP
ncbi:MAG TPA: hypothetical protein DCY72_01665, partial [Ruminococcaceae bacterium]|nr:hypothetical protein [Oscillospiraceae bacterium]